MPSSQGSNDSDFVSCISQTSTELYSEQEAFVTFQHRVRTLCTTLWPSVPSEAFTIEKMGGGSYNRVIGITVPRTPVDSDSLEDKRYILRIPRGPSVSIKSELAILRFIRQKSSIPVPEIVFFDLTCENPLGDRYNIQPRILGVSLQDVWKGLSQVEKLAIVRQTAHFLRAMHKLRSPIPGYLSAANPTTATENDGDRQLAPEVRIVNFLSKTLEDLDGNVMRGGMSDDSAKHKTTFQLLIDQFDNWQDFGRACNRGEPEDELMERFREVTRQMEQLDLLKGNDFVLFHPDLYPRNIMVSKDGLVGETSGWKISGILDWDTTTYVPYSVACAPPAWIWENWDEEEEAVLCKMPEDLEAQERRKLFDTLMGTSYTDHAYPACHQFFRRLFHLARVGISNPQQDKEANIFFPEWNGFFETVTKTGTTDEIDTVSEVKVELGGHTPKKTLTMLEVREGLPIPSKSSRGLTYRLGNKVYDYCSIQ